MLSVFAPGRVAGQPGLRQRRGRRRLRHRAHARLPEHRRPAGAAGREPLDRPACSTRGRWPSSAPPTSRRSIGRVLMQNLLSGGFAGPVYPVNPAHERVANMRCYPSVHDVPDDVALAIVAVPPEQLEAVLDDAIAKHVRGLLIVTGDLPGGTDDEAPLVRRLVTRARGNGIRIIGPASMGVLDDRSGLGAAGRARADTRPPGRRLHLAAVRTARHRPPRDGLPTRRRPGQLRLARRQGRRQRQRPPPVLGGRPGDVGRPHLHRELRQPPQVRPHRPPPVAPQAHRRRPGRRRRRSHHGGAVRAGRRDPRAHRPPAVRHRPRARRPAAAAGATA